jgi:hypothetical protein
LHELVKCCARKSFASSGTNDVLVMPGWVSTSRQAPIPLDAVVEAEIRNSSRPGSQAPHAPPALTFGLTGKQKVKSGGTGCVLRRRVNSLPQFGEILSIERAEFPWNPPGAR